jgi:hypothetical protein
MPAVPRPLAARILAPVVEGLAADAPATTKLPTLESVIAGWVRKHGPITVALADYFDASVSKDALVVTVDSDTGEVTLSTSSAPAGSVGNGKPATAAGLGRPAAVGPPGKL